MKAVLVTFSRAYNNGALLQCYALYRKLKEAGNECVVLDYYPDYFRHLYNVTKKFNLRHPPIKTYIQHALLHKTIKRRNASYEAFIRDNIEMSRTLNTYEDVEKYCPDADFYVTGSDQVWNYGCTYFDKTFFLDFDMAKKSRRYSYAACLGFKREKLTDDLFDEYKRRLTGYEGLSVRESSAISIVEELTGRKVRLDIDPTLLLDEKEWSDVAKNQPEDKPYVLIYYVQRTHALQNYALRLVDIYKEKGKEVKVICVPCNTAYDILSGKYDAEYGFDQRPYVGPAQLLGLIKNAECVLTNSFHGTVFSILFGKPFLSRIIEDSGKRNVRTEDLLKLMDLGEREIRSESDLLRVFEEIDYSAVKTKLKELRYESVSYINEMH